VDLEFFETLYKDSEFCEALGRMALASGRFESDLRAFLGLKGVKITEGRATLGNLITQLENKRLLSENGAQILRHLKRQRNYLAHSLFDLFASRIDETLITRKGLGSGDEAVFTEYAQTLEGDLRGLARSAEERIAQFDAAERLSTEDDRLF
jgi:hypothetical protein